MCSHAAFASMWMLLATTMTTVAVQHLGCQHGINDVSVRFPFPGAPWAWPSASPCPRSAQRTCLCQTARKATPPTTPTAEHRMLSAPTPTSALTTRATTCSLRVQRSPPTRPTSPSWAQMGFLKKRPFFNGSNPSSRPTTKIMRYIPYTDCINQGTQTQKKTKCPEFKCHYSYCKQFWMDILEPKTVQSNLKTKISLRGYNRPNSADLRSSAIFWEVD